MHKRVNKQTEYIMITMLVKWKMIRCNSEVQSPTSPLQMGEVFNTFMFSCGARAGLTRASVQCSGREALTGCILLREHLMSNMSNSN